MTELTSIDIKPPYLIMLGDVQEKTFAKTGFGILQWRPEFVAGQLRLPNCKVDMGIPDLTIQQAIDANVKSLIIGVAPMGGIIPDSWLHVIGEAVSEGIDIICGLHFKLADNLAIKTMADITGSRLIDVRNPPKYIPIGTGKKRSGKRILTVGTDCAVGKKYTALAIELAMKSAGIQSTFRATGQTGIMIAGSGIPVDAEVADFISGAAEVVSPANDENHWDVIEGQGSLFHPAYAGVTLGLIHGSQPDAIVVCHDAARTHISGLKNYLLPSVNECIERHLAMATLTNPHVRCVGISVNTSGLPKEDRAPYLAALATETNLPCIDPLIDGCDSIVEQIHQYFPLTQTKETKTEGVVC